LKAAVPTDRCAMRTSVAALIRVLSNDNLNSLHNVLKPLLQTLDLPQLHYILQQPRLAPLFANVTQGCLESLLGYVKDDAVGQAYILYEVYPRYPPESMTGFLRKFAQPA